jgi:hypothetical protein
MSKNKRHDLTKQIILTSKLENIIIYHSVKGFLLNYKSNKYIISVHHGLPILDTQDILINCSWNELLILNNSSDLLNLKEIKQLKYKIPPINNNLYIMYNYNNEIKLIIEDYTLININNLPTNPQIIYIKASIISYQDTLKSLSGSPVFNIYNKLIGIFCKQENNYVYILPTYYIIKTLEKKNNYSIYNINFNEPIKNINNYIVKNNTIYHASLNMNIPLNAYFLLNGDEDNSILINKNYRIKYTDITNELPISNDRNIIEEDNVFIVNASLLLFLKLLNPNIIKNFIEFIKNHLGEKILLSINKNIKSNNKINKKIKYNNIKYKLTMYIN